MALTTMARTVTAHDPAPHTCTAGLQPTDASPPPRLQPMAAHGCHPYPRLQPVPHSRSPWPRTAAGPSHSQEPMATHGGHPYTNPQPMATHSCRLKPQPGAHGHTQRPPLYKAAAHGQAQLPAVATARNPWPRTCNRSTWPRMAAAIATAPHHAAQVSRCRTRLGSVHPVPPACATAVHSAHAVVMPPALGQPSVVKPPHCCWCTWAADGLLLTLAASRCCCLWGQCSYTCNTQHIA